MNEHLSIQAKEKSGTALTQQPPAVSASGALTQASTISNWALNFLPILALVTTVAIHLLAFSFLIHNETTATRLMIASSAIAGCAILGMGVCAAVYL